VCNSRPQLSSFLATNIQPSMQPLPQYFPRLLSTVKMGKRDFKIPSHTFQVYCASFILPHGHIRYAMRGRIFDLRPTPVTILLRLALHPR
jgi:hypothetical protein